MRVYDWQTTGLDVGANSRGGPSDPVGLGLGLPLLAHLRGRDIPKPVRFAGLTQRRVSSPR